VGPRWGGLASLYEAYYSLRPPVEAPSELPRREFAFQYLGSDTFTRHLSFSTYEELVEHMAERPPLHAYYSIAVYELPEARSMEEKGFLRAPLFFDIDVDHLPGCEGPLPTDECLMEGLRHARRLEAVARRDLGASETLVYYTGNRGFHVIVECGDDCEEIGREERREIAWYVAAEGLKLEAIIPEPPKGYQPASPTTEDPGWRGWIARALTLDAPGLEDALGPEWRSRVLEAVNEYRVPIDMQVTPDTSRLSRIRGTLNGKASLLVARVGEGWRPDYRLLSPFTGEVTVRCPEGVPEERVLGYPLGLAPGEEASLPAQVGVLLYTKGLCELTGGEVVVRASPGGGPL